MANPPTADLPPPIFPPSVQPGGGFCMSLELAWGRLRRGYLRLFQPGYVREMLAKRQGTCTGNWDVIDPRDLKFCRNVCGYSFKPEDDHFQWRGQLGFARAGLCELIVFSLLFFGLAAVAATLAIEVHWGFWVVWVACLVFELEIVWFFRDPPRAIPDDPRVLVSPADGTVTHVEEVAEPDFPGGRALRISIFLSIFNVHVNRQPRTARVTNIRYYPGAFLDARHAESAQRNEQLWVDMVEPNGRRIRVKQISGAIARRIVCWLRLEEEVPRGERIGMIKFGSRTDLLVPVEPGTEVLVKVGDKLQGGSSVLLRFGDGAPM